MRIFARPSLRTGHLENIESSYEKICPYPTVIGDEDYEMRNRIEKGLWDIHMEQEKVDAVVKLIGQYNGRVERRRLQSRPLGITRLFCHSIAVNFAFTNCFQDTRPPQT